MKVADMSMADLARWTVEDQRRFGGWIFGALDPKSHTTGFNRFRRDVLRCRAVRLDEFASYKVGVLSASPIGVVENLFAAARMPWPAMIVEVDQKAIAEGVALMQGARDSSSGDDVAFLLTSDPDYPGEVTATTLLDMRMKWDEAESSQQWERLSPAQRRAVKDCPLGVEPWSFQINFTGPEPSRESPMTRAVTEGASRYIDRWLDRVRKKITPDSDISAAEQLIRGSRDPLSVMNLGGWYLPGNDVVQEGKVISIALEEVMRRDALSRRMAPVACPYMAVPPTAAAIDDYLGETIGTPRIVAALIGALALTGGTESGATRPKGTHIVAGRRTPYLARTTVRIDLEQTDPRLVEPKQRTLTGDRARHDVRGHWMYVRGSRRSCAEHAPSGHVWQELVREEADGHDRQVCSLCGSRRTWRAEHKRGSVEAGLTLQTDVRVTHGGGRGRRRKLRDEPRLAPSLERTPND